MSEACPVCFESVKVNRREDADYIECARCGCFALSGTARAVLASSLRGDKKARARVSHSISKMSRAGRWPMISSDLLRNIVENTENPSPPEQVDNLVLWLGATQEDAGARVDATPRAISAVGAVDHGGLGFVVSEARRHGLISVEIKVIQGISGPSTDYVISPMQLTMEGWRRFDDLRRGQTASRVAFMAMPFGDAHLDRHYREHFKPAVAATGFTLKRLDEEQPAGLIDDRLWVEIRQSRFLISDLTHRNPGAYWEAGYAEGLGKPVIYTCRKDAFEDKKLGPHFDTNHHLIVIWEAANLDSAMSRLKDTIRATLPDEAVLSDEI
jgi:hypothetical protein